MYKRIVVIALVVLLAGCVPVVMTPVPSSTVQPTPSRSPQVTVLPKPTVPLASPVPENASKKAEAVIELERSGGLAGKTQQWRIYQDGRIVATPGRESVIAEGQVATLLAAVTSLEVFNLEDVYGRGTQCRDCFTIQLTVRSGGRVKTIVAVPEATDTPAQLNKILDQINNVLSSFPQG